MSWVLFAALAGAPIMFLTVAWTLVNPAPGLLIPAGGAQPLPMTTLVGLGAAAVVAGGLAIVIRTVFATPERLVVAAVPEGQPPSLVPPESDDERRLAASVGRWQTAFIVSLAVSESMAVMGFVLSFLALDLTYILVGAFLAVTIDILFLRPDPTIYEKLADRVRG